jgi:hypothetical protein
MKKVASKTAGQEVISRIAPEPIVLIFAIEAIITGPTDQLV